jgi:hypothetical protein
LDYKGCGTRFKNIEIGDSRMNDKQVFVTILGGMIFAVSWRLAPFHPNRAGAT